MKQVLQSILYPVLFQPADLQVSFYIDRDLRSNAASEFAALSSEVRGCGVASPQEAVLFVQR